MNKRLKIFLHIAFWTYMFISPLAYTRGMGMLAYLVNCVSPLLTMVVFYADYHWLTYKYFVAGKQRYFLMINAVMVVSLGLATHYWMDYAQVLFQPNPALRMEFSTLENVLYTLRDIINLIIFATAATCIALSQQWYWADQARNRAEAARTDAELSNLRNQINPHFLLNTLNNIYALTAFDAPKAQSAIQELSKMMRHILYDYQQPTVSLQDEVEFLKNYVRLMKIRLPESVEIVFEPHVTQPNVSIAPMIFISLVENAFKHGVSPTEPSFIHISIFADEQNIICDIRNSNHPKSATDDSGHGIGLRQVERRLELAYFEHYTWTKGVSADGKEYHSRIHITGWKEANKNLKKENANQ